MGHQLRVYLTPTDTAELAREISHLEPVAILHSRSPSAKPRIAPSLTLVEDGKPWLFYYLVRESELLDVVTRHIPAQDHWIVDVVKSPVIEFNACYFNNKILRQGRIYYVDGFYGADSTWIEKPEAFRLWAAGVLKTTKNVLRRNGSEYIGETALAWLERENGRLEP
jgi:hypothetical protein